MATDSTVRISTTQPITISSVLNDCTVIQCAEAAAILLHIHTAPATAQVLTYYSSDEAAGTYVLMRYYATEGSLTQQITAVGMYSTPAELFAAKFIKVKATSGSAISANAIMKT